MPAMDLRRSFLFCLFHAKLRNVVFTPALPPEDIIRLRVREALALGTGF